MVSNQNSKPTEIESATNLMLCSSCVGWYYDYCSIDDLCAIGPSNCIRENKIVKCPYDKYHFIPTRHFSNRAQVVKAFPENF